MRHLTLVATAYPFVATLGALQSAAIGAASGAVGAQILSEAGVSGYDVLQATRHAAVGGAVTGPVQALLLPRASTENLIVQVVASFVLTAPNAAMGAAMLHALENPWLNAGKSALASAVGAALLLVTTASVGSAYLCHKVCQRNESEPQAGNLEQV